MNILIVVDMQRLSMNWRAIKLGLPQNIGRLRLDMISYMI